jgi:hypothetical protein
MNGCHMNVLLLLKTEPQYWSCTEQPLVSLICCHKIKDVKPITYKYCDAECHDYHNSSSSINNDDDNDNNISNNSSCTQLCMFLCGT